MAVSVKARVDVAVSTYMDITASNDQPATTVGLRQDQLPAGYFSGGSFLKEVDNDDDSVYNSIAGIQLTAGAGSSSQIVASGDDASALSGVLILRNSGKRTSAKTTAADAGSDIEIYVAAEKICTLTVENKDVFCIPFTGQAMSVFKAKALGSTSTVWLEYTCICGN